VNEKPTRLLAKFSETPESPRGAERLRGHTAFVLAAAEQLLEHRGATAIRAAGLDGSQYARFERWVLAAAFAHDLGKCSEHFQETVRHRRKYAQLVRHEACSLYISWPGQPLGEWLGRAFEDERELRFALIAAAAHHRKFLRRAIASDDAGAGTTLTLWTSHDDFRSTLALAKQWLGLSEAPPLSDIVIKHDRRSTLRAFFERCEEEVAELRPTHDEQRLLAVAKAFVIDADVAGSALPRASEKPGWIRDVLNRPRNPADLNALVERRLDGQPLRPFQCEVAASREPVTLVRAGCGTGKTAAAYAWASRSHPGRTVWITYPTTGTATEGYRDYVYEASVKGRLEHGRALVDVQMFGLDDPGEPQRELDRLDALRAWDMDVITCTVDTVLGLVQNQRKGLYAFASLCHSAVVFDEIHAYDGELFGALLRFLTDLPNVPALLMTASLPDARLRALRDVVRQVHGRPLAMIEGPRDLEDLPRYQRADGDPWDHVKRVLKGDGKVLWVSNSVDRCLALSEHQIDAPSFIYHSRFRYKDRVARHGAVIDAFRPQTSGPVLAATTQVAEMSLDLSADLLVTDLAPIPALIQRLGRLNRRSRPDAPRPVASFAVIEPEHPAPYHARELQHAREWLGRLGSGELSQRDLVDAWIVADEPIAKPVRSAWVDGVFHTEPAALREPSPGITVIREQDVACANGDVALAPWLALPMNPPPRQYDWKRWPRAVGIYPVAPPSSIEYDRLRGARWRDRT
jgi:CRISPR-associated endonuclease/helicase Cas3